ncbi:glycosyltransferase family 39 protein [bacterium]|nr:glycosyltransferase family 39 protein [bacterium]
MQKQISRQIFTKRDLPIMISLGIFALILRLIRLFDLDVWLDEVVLLRMIEKSYIEIWSFCQTDNFPPLLPWMLKAWNSLFPGELSLRVFCTLLGALTPPAAYLLGKVVSGRNFGILIGVACVVSAPLIYYSQMIRMYTLFPFFACLSFIGLIMGLRTNQWKYWILMAVANLFGFYLFVFMLFMIMMEAIVLLIANKNWRTTLIRAIITHIPTVILVTIWVIPLFSRYQNLQESFWLKPVSYTHVGEVWYSLGSGTDFFDRYKLAALVNIPFLLGVGIGLKKFWKQDATRAAYLIFAGVIITVFVLSLKGQNIFFKRYFMFLIPSYLAMVYWGWMSLQSGIIRRAGLVLTSISLLVSVGYYYGSYLEYHQHYFFPVSETGARASDGHAIKKLVTYISENSGDNDVILHYAHPEKRSFTFFSSVYYKQNDLPEYIYSAKAIPDHFGGQYMERDEWLRSLDDLNFQPTGIWVVSLDSLEAVFDKNYLGGRIRGWTWVQDENLPAEIYANHYVGFDTIRFGQVTAIHYAVDHNVESPHE